MNTHERSTVAIIGAGPAGLFAARELAFRGSFVAIFNRDIKPGGLAEYGIYPTKHKMKDGLRNQFRQILSHPEIEYFGSVRIGAQGDLSLDDLRGLAFHALLVTVGAQSTKRLGIEGEDFSGVYHAKDIVYHYNNLPPFSEHTYQIGKRVAVIGVGNVMVDIARWLIEEKNVDAVTAVARRGPADVKFDKKELETIAACVNMRSLNEELQRIAPAIQRAGQDEGPLLGLIEDAMSKAEPKHCYNCFSMRFLSSPTRVIGGASGQAVGLEVEENELIVSEDGRTRAVGTGRFTVLDVDTIIFAIGDVVDSTIGLPVQYGEYVKNPQPRFPVEGASYEAYDPHTGLPISDVFLAGWARRPSTGLVGVARKDGVNAANAVGQYLASLPQFAGPTPEALRARLSRINHPIVDKQMLQKLEDIERERAASLNAAGFKFASNQMMLEALGLAPERKSRGGS